MPKFGWCFGAEGAEIPHTNCTKSFSTNGKVIECDCYCHSEKKPVAKKKAKKKS